MFFVDNKDKIAEFVSSIISSIGSIASGAISAAAKFVEKSMALTIPLILDFLAKMLNLGGIAERITKIIQRIRKPIDQVIDRIINFFSNKIKKLFGKGKNKKNKGKGDDDDDHENSKNKTKKDFDKDKGDDKTTDVDRKEHKKIVKEIVKRLKSKSKAEKLEEGYQEKSQLAKSLEQEYTRQLKNGLKVTIRFESYDQVKKDSKISVQVIIAPNNTEEDFELSLTLKDGFDPNDIGKLNNMIFAFNKNGGKFEQFSSADFKTFGAKYNITNAKNIVIFQNKDTNEELGKIEFKEPYELVENAINPVYKHIKTNELFVQDKIGQFIPRIMHRFITEHDLASLKKGEGIKPSASNGKKNNVSNELEHVQGVKASIYIYP